MTHPRDVLLGAQAQTGFLPVCDHYSGVEARMRKSLQLQAEMTQEFGTCVFDVTLDCEDGAPVGLESEHARLVAALAVEAAPGARVAARVHAVDHPAFANDVATIVGEAGHRLSHVMVPKVESVDDVLRAERALDRAGPTPVPLHVLIESPAAVHRAFEIAAHPRVQSLSFGLMDFVSAHGGAIPAQGMTSAGQFSHPLAIARCEIEMASLMALKAAWAFDQGLPAGEFSNIAKYAGAEAGIHAVDAAIQTHGGNGFTKEYGIYDLYGLVRLLRTAPLNRELVLNYIAEHVMGLPRSY